MAARSDLSAYAARDALASARARLRVAQARWTKARRALARGYRAARARARARWAAYRAVERERVRQQIDQWRRELQHLWAARRARVAALHESAAARARALIAHRQQRLREASGLRKREARAWSSHRAAERQGESDEAVRRELEANHPELVELWRDKLRHRFPAATPKMSRLEQVLHWAHDNSDEVLAARSESEARELERLLVEHARAERAHARASGRPVRRRQAVPF